MLERGTPSASAAISPIVVFAPPPTSVTPTCTQYFPFASTRTTALLRPRPARNAMNETPAPRLIGPASEPGDDFQRFFHSNVSAPLRMHSSSEYEVYGV